MRLIKLLFTIIITGTLLTSCTSVIQTDLIDNSVSLEQVVTNYDLWYIDYHRTTGAGDVPFISRAFTMSFVNGTLYANNNIANIGETGTGNGFGIAVGSYSTYNGFLETNHDLDGRYDFDVVQLNALNEIRIYDSATNVTYYLVGYNIGNFDYEKLFNENIEYFLQEYVAWERTGLDGGVANALDDENFLQFTPENNTTFWSSHDPFGTNVGSIVWDFVGSYSIVDYVDNNNIIIEDLKELTLNYENGDTEFFVLSVITDNKISLLHEESGTRYDFSGRGFLQYRKSGGQSAKSAVRNNGRKRTKIKREQKLKNI